MKCVLMNKNTKVIVLEYNTILNGFSEIYEIKNIEYAPLIIFNNYKDNKSDDTILTNLSEWFKGRGIPSWRDELDLLLFRLDITTPRELLDKAFCLSLSDQYWIKPYSSNILYKDINFFEHVFEDSEFVDLTFGSNISTDKISLVSPNNTTDGRLKKTWIIDNNKRYLLKSGYKSEVMQPFNEVLASMICQKLGFYHVPYTLDVVHNQVVSKCPCFINTSTELVTAYQVLYKNCNKINAYEDYIKILEKNNILDAKEQLENMIVLDYIILNEDRHLNNFGIIRNVETLKWESVAPIFDNGQSLNIIDYNDEEVLANGDGRFFYGPASFDDMLLKVENIKRYDLSKLDGIVEEFETLLKKYSHITNMTDRRINKICTLLYSRIKKLKNYIDNK